MDLTDRVALITGASRGIGLAIAHALVGKGARVALVARSAKDLDAAAVQLGVGRSAVFALDVCDRGALVQLPTRVVERFGRLDIIVCSAGVNHRGAVLGRTVEELAQVIDANLVAPVLLARAALPHMSRGGALVNVASLAGKVPVPLEATYSASKAGLRAFSRALGAELHGAGIHVTAVCPGPVDTGFFGDVRQVPDLVFSQPMSTAERVAAATVHALETGRNEVDVPAMSGVLATLGYLSPALFAALRPWLERRGARNKAAYLARRGAEPRTG